MKNQNDLIIAVVSIVFGLIGVGVAFGMRPASKAAAMPTAVDLSAPVIKNAEVPMTNGISGSKNASGGGGARGGAMGGPTAAGQAGGGGGPSNKGPMAAGQAGG